ncbi:MAG TPA: pentapeptide repeat-containing protein [Allosphingosinicella sp.]
MSVKTATRIDRILDCSSDNFGDLVLYSGLQPKEDFKFKVLRNVDFNGSDLRHFDFTGSIFENCRFQGAKVREESFSGSHFIGEDFRRAETRLAAGLAEGSLLSGSIGLAPPPHRLDKDLHEVLRELERRAGSHDWHIHFRLAWYEFRGDPLLLELAEWWLQTHGRSGKQAALTMIAILATPTAQVGGVLEVAHRWLQAEPVKDTTWVYLWRLVLRSAPKRPPLLALGASWVERLLARLLEDGPPHHALERAWVELWKSLSIEPQFETLLLSAAEVASAKLRSVPFVTQILVPLLGQSRHLPSLAQALYAWLETTDPCRRSWSDVYEAVLEAIAHNEPAIWLGLQRLSVVPEQDPAWPRICLALIRNGDEPSALDVAERWLSNSDVRTSAWPTVLIEFIGRRTPEPRSMLRWQASEWLALGKRHPHKQAIRDFAEDGSARRPSIDGTSSTSLALLRVRLMRHLGQELGFALWKERGTRFWGNEGRVRAVCLLSKRHDAKADRGRYWFGYYDSAHQFLVEGERSFLILAPTDRPIYYAIPLKALRRFLKGLPRTVRRHNFYWHLELMQRGQSTVLKTSGPGPGFDVTSFVRTYDPGQL